MNTLAGNRNRSQRGMTLLEVLVSILIFSLGILGLVGLLARASQLSLDAEDRNRASLLANELAAAMWAAGSTNASNAVLQAWDARVKDTRAGGLPNATTQVTVDNNGVATIQLTWTPPARANRRGEATTFSTQVVVQ